jgi:aspartyl-tRNA(Asn)/glutamyl-tRNA(Gln) amidotransferase subunit C
MARVTVETVAHVARLAHVSLTAAERVTFARQLDEVLAYAESIQSLDTHDVPPMSHAASSGLFREDAVVPGLARDTVLPAAPDPADGLYRVPRIIGG